MNPESGTLARAIEIAARAHAGQKDKNGAPYILHPIRVMARLETETEMIVGVLHDVPEDSQPPDRWGIEDLRAEGFSEGVLEALDCVTKREGEDYAAFIGRAEAHPVARRVKLADLEDNMDIRRLREVDARTAERLARYLEAWTRLRGKVTCQEIPEGTPAEVRPTPPECRHD